MVDKNKISRRTVLGGAVGSLLGFLGIKPEDSTSEGVNKVIGGAAAGAVIGGVSAVGDSIHSKIKPKPSQKFTEAEKHYRKGVVDETLREKAEERAKRRRGDGENQR